MNEIYEMPVSKANMTDEVLNIFDEMAANNRQYNNTQECVQIRSWSVGTPDGDTSDHYWKVVIYDRLGELFYVYQLHYYWEFDTTKCNKSLVTLTRDDMLSFLGNTQAYGERKVDNTQEVA